MPDPMPIPQNGQNIPPPPPGFVSDSTAMSGASSNIPPPPPGFVPDQPSSGQQTQPQNPMKAHMGGMVGNALDSMADVSTGVGKGMIDTMKGTLAGAAPHAEPAMDRSHINDVNTNAENTSQAVGKGIEDMGEFAAGDEALKGLSTASKMVQLADKSPLIARTLELAKEHPVLAKMISSAGNVGKAAAVGGAQGAVKGEAKGDATGGAEAGALSAAAGGVVGETAGAIAEALGKRIHIGTTGEQDATQGIKPGKRNYRFADDFQKAAPYLDAEHQISPNKTAKDWAESADEARTKLWQQQIQPVVDRYSNHTLDGSKIASFIRAQVPEGMRDYSPEEAQKMENLASGFEKGQNIIPSVGSAEKAIEHFNAKLSKTGYWDKLPNQRAALLQTDGDMASYKAIADGLRENLYSKIDELEHQTAPLENRQPLDLSKAKQDYGALRNVGNELWGRVNVEGRQAPISLKEAVGIITGIGTGGWKGALMAALPSLDRAANSSASLTESGVQKVARPDAMTLGKTAQKVGGAVKEKVPAAAAAIGEEVMPSQRVTFRDSHGGVHSIPADQLAEAMKIDPNLKVVQ